MPASDEQFLRRAIALAHQARQRGLRPFGAVLVVDNTIAREGFDRSLELSDPTYHVELSLISEYCRAHRLLSLRGFTLYASTEPCPMCAGAAHWSRISRIVFSLSQQMLQSLSGGRPKPSCESLLADYPEIEIVGPLLPEEGLRVFEGYVFNSAVER
jgi:tRNA(adenine34) deaminase